MSESEGSGVTELQEQRLELVARARVGGAASYLMSVTEEQAQLDVLDAEQENIFRVTWNTKISSIYPASGQGSRRDITLLELTTNPWEYLAGPFSVTLEGRDTSFRFEAKPPATGDGGIGSQTAYFNGQPVEDVLNVIQGEAEGLLRDYHTYTINAALDMHENVRARRAEEPGSMMDKKSEEAMMEVICNISSACAGFWPYGTMICGPTAIGTCIVYPLTTTGHGSSSSGGIKLPRNVEVRRRRD